MYDVHQALKVKRNFVNNDVTGRLYIVTEARNDTE